MGTGNQLKKIEFKQNDLKRGIPLAVIYFVAVFTICYLIFGGIIGMADAVNNFGSAKGVGLLVGLGFLAPFFVLRHFVMPKNTIEFYPDKITIYKNKKEETVIYYSNIAAMQLNVSNMNQLDIMDGQQNILYHIQPQNKLQVLEETVSEISKYIDLQKQKGSKRYFGKSIETCTYIRRR
ncbi:hypothetical protein [Edaphocola flava]|uniref:hypothetical protein n=1 Tax=Edaphocola flava TaxID=2499629 RepID=UPI00100B56BC|nr:hypothetical protein [Edaphocola flava]